MCIRCNDLQLENSCGWARFCAITISLRKKTWIKFANKSVEHPPVQSAPTEIVLPEWGDVGDVKRLFGLRESFTYELLRQGRIKTAMDLRPWQ